MPVSHSSSDIWSLNGATAPERRALLHWNCVRVNSIANVRTEIGTGDMKYQFILTCIYVCSNNDDGQLDIHDDVGIVPIMEQHGTF